MQRGFDVVIREKAVLNKKRKTKTMFLYVFVKAALRPQLPQKYWSCRLYLRRKYNFYNDVGKNIGFELSRKIAKLKIQQEILLLEAPSTEPKGKWI